MTEARLRLRTTFLALLGVCWAASAGCTAGPGGDGPLRAGGDRVEVCLPLSPDAGYAFGLHVLANASDDALEIESVELAGAQGVTIDESFVVPIARGADGGYTLVGNASSWPPPPEFSSARGVSWDDRATVPGAEVPPASVGPAAMNLVLHLSAGPGGGSFDHLLIGYRSNGQRFGAQTNAGVVIQASCF